MGKIIFFFSLFGIWLNAQDINPEDKLQLQKECIVCHVKQQIPSDLVYRRYLMKYSTVERIQKKMFTYLKTPDQKYSIMPPQFFLKFPMKGPSILDDATLQKMIKLYIRTLDVKKKLVLPE